MGEARRAAMGPGSGRYQPGRATAQGEARGVGRGGARGGDRVSADPQRTSRVSVTAAGRPEMLGDVRLGNGTPIVLAALALGATGVASGCATGSAGGSSTPAGGASAPGRRASFAANPFV